MNKEEKQAKIVNYLTQFVDAHYETWNDFYQSVYKNREHEIYKLLEGGSDLLNLLEQIVFYTQAKFLIGEEPLIPTSFADLEQLIDSLKGQISIIGRYKNVLKKNYKGEDTYYIVTDLMEMVDDINRAVRYCEEIYQTPNVNIPLPYSRLINSLGTKNIDEFIDFLSSIISGIPYSTRKEKLNEGYFHTIFHILLTLLGFDIISEKETNIGRIDASVFLDNVIYVFEFKYTDENKDKSGEAFSQICSKKYIEAYKLKNKEIIVSV